MTHFAFALPFVLAYLLGSVSFAVLVSKMAGLADPRTYGSHNPGATNVLRSGNKTAAALTLLGDALKGTAAVLLAQHFQTPWGVHPEQLPWVGLAAFLGHLYPVFLKFKGGKGVATALGVLLGLDWMLGVATAATWLLVAKMSRYSSLAAMVASVCAIGYHAWLDNLNWGTLAIALMTALLLYRHSNNIRQLLAGTENQIGQKNRPKRSKER